MTLENKIILITGAAAGLGKEIARKLIEQKAIVVLSDNNAEALQNTAQELASTFFVADVSREADVGKLYHQIKDKYRTLDVSIHNAGIGKSISIAESTLDDFDRLIGVNLKGIYLCTKEALKTMNLGTIINISSGLIRVPGYANLSLYSMSKAGVEQFTQCVAKEQLNVKLFTVLPGRMNTELHQRMFPKYPTQKLLDPKVVAEKIVRLIEGSQFIESGTSFEFYA